MNDGFPTTGRVIGDEEHPERETEIFAVVLTLMFDGCDCILDLIEESGVALSALLWSYLRSIVKVVV